jgi:hypothetical protein
MKRLFYLCMLSACTALPAYAQPNVLGLPAVPQGPGAPVAAPTPASSGARKAGIPASLPFQIADQQAKSVLSGGISLASSYVGRQATVRATTNAVFNTPEQRTAAINAARLVQRDVALACAKQCTTAPMPPGKILPDGKLQFEMVINEYPRPLSNDDMVAMLMGQPLKVLPKTPASAPAKPGAPAGMPVAVPLRPIEAPTTPAPTPSNASSGAAQ